MTEIISTNPRDPDPALIRKVVQFLKDGQVVAYPTETFYGLGVDVHNEKAIKQLYKLKQRDYGLPISILVSDIEMLAKVVTEISDTARQLIKSFWPGPLTILFPAHKSISKSLSTNTGKIGVRVSSHPVATALVRELGGPITTTSANLTSFPPSLNIKHIQTYFKDRLACIIDVGEGEPSRGSTVIDVAGDTMAIIRDGAIPADDVIKKFQET
jgi:L-threonylcarbamoyladenylate synthase